MSEAGCGDLSAAMRTYQAYKVIEELPSGVPYVAGRMNSQAHGANSKA